MRRWPYSQPLGISPEDAQIYCVEDANWQTVRLKMKGQPTEKKLDILNAWMRLGQPSATMSNRPDITNPKGYTVCEIKNLQITNYLGALRRGGQLDSNNAVKKEL